MLKYSKAIPFSFMTYYRLYVKGCKMLYCGIYKLTYIGPLFHTPIFHPCIINLAVPAKHKIHITSFPNLAQTQIPPPVLVLSLWIWHIYPIRVLWQTSVFPHQKPLVLVHLDALIPKCAYSLIVLFAEPIRSAGTCHRTGVDSGLEVSHEAYPGGMTSPHLLPIVLAPFQKTMQFYPTMGSLAQKSST